MKVGDIGTLIDYSILLFHKYTVFLNDNNFRSEMGWNPAQGNQAFVVKSHSVWEIRKTIEEFQPVPVTLRHEEKEFVLLLLGASLYGQNGINIWQAMCFFHRLPYKAMKSLGGFLDPSGGFLKSGMVMFQQTDFLGTALSIEDIADFYNNRKIFLSPFALNSIFSNLTGKHIYGVTNYTLTEKYKNVDVLLGDVQNIMKYLFFLANFYKMNYTYSPVLEDVYEKGDFSHTLKQFQKNIVRSGLKIPLVPFLKTHRLDNVEFVVLLYFIFKVLIAKEFIINNLEEVLASLAFIPSQIKKILACFARDSVFVKENFIGQLDYYAGFPFEEEMEEEEEASTSVQDEGQFGGISSDFNSISISRDKIYQLIFSEWNPKEPMNAPVQSEAGAGESGAQEKNRGLYEIVVPRVTINDVILDEDVKKELLGAVDLTKAVETMKKWGIKPNLGASSFGSIKILLHGASGTGKTITAQALAGEAGADLFKVDASNLVSSWIGESTKNVKRVFREFYKTAKASPKRIFLFMNEADQLLSARGSVLQAADKEYNQMQNLLLEELENFDGVFIATTNLIDLFDTAWNRRFNIKIKFDIPKYDTRRKLWKVHISEKMPLAPDVDFNKLAEYELAGGSIANVVYNAARKAALREGDQRMVTQQDFIDSIMNELKSHLGLKNAKVGFQQ